MESIIIGACFLGLQTPCNKTHGIAGTQPSSPLSVEDKGERDDLWARCPFGKFRGPMRKAA